MILIASPTSHAASITPYSGSRMTMMRMMIMAAAASVALTPLFATTASACGMMRGAQAVETDPFAPPPAAGGVCGSSASGGAMCGGGSTADRSPLDGMSGGASAAAPMEGMSPGRAGGCGCCASMAMMQGGMDRGANPTMNDNDMPGMEGMDHGSMPGMEGHALPQSPKP